eukprot:289449-Amphidinium_carterae.1
MTNLRADLERRITTQDAWSQHQQQAQNHYQQRNAIPVQNIVPNVVPNIVPNVVPSVVPNVVPSVVPNVVPNEPQTECLTESAARLATPCTVCDVATPCTVRDDGQREAPPLPLEESARLEVWTFLATRTFMALREFFCDSFRVIYDYNQASSALLTLSNNLEASK